jgi:hypothetical protein
MYRHLGGWHSVCIKIVRDKAPRLRNEGVGGHSG